MLRISGGRFRGQKIEAPNSKLVRPTTGMVRESLFSMFAADIQEARFLDLFAGSGLMGVEALSRGAAFVLAIEQRRSHAMLIQKNYTHLKLSPEEANVLCMDAHTFVAKVNKREPFGVVFLDPPYGYDDTSEILAHLKENAWLTEDALIILEQATSDALLAGFTRKIYGDTAILWHHGGH